MPGKNQAQKRRDRAKSSRDREATREQQVQNQDPATQATQSQQSQTRQQQNQARQRAQPISTNEILDKEGTLEPALEDLESLNLLSTQERQRLQSLRISSRLLQQLDRLCHDGAHQEPSQQDIAKQDFLTAIIDRLQAFLSDNENSSKQRRQVRRAKEVIEYHQEFPSRYRATHQLRRDREQSCQDQQGQAQASQRQQGQSQNPQQQVGQTPASRRWQRPAQQRSASAEPAAAQLAPGPSHESGQHQGQASQQAVAGEAAQGERHDELSQQGLMHSQDEADFYAEVLGIQFASLISELRLLRILSLRDVQQIRPPQTGKDWFDLMRELEGKVEARTYPAGRNAPQARALNLIEGLRTLITELSRKEMPSRESHPPPAALREAWVQRRLRSLRSDSVRQAVRKVEAEIDEERGRFMQLLEGFQSFGLVSRERVHLHRTPQSWVDQQDMLDSLHRRIDAYKQNGGIEGISAEQQERLDALKRQLIVYQVRFRG